MQPGLLALIALALVIAPVRTLGAQSRLPPSAQQAAERLRQEQQELERLREERLELEARMKQLQSSERTTCEVARNCRSRF